MNKIKPKIDDICFAFEIRKFTSTKDKATFRYKFVNGKIQALQYDNLNIIKIAIAGTYYNNWFYSILEAKKALNKELDRLESIIKKVK